MENATLQHIVIICSYLNVPGGYEKMIVNAANLFIENGYQVTLVILDEPETVFYPLDKKVQIIQKNLTFGNSQKGNPFTRKLMLLKDVLRLRKLFAQLQPHHILATEYIYAVTAILAGGRKFGNVFSWEHHHYGTLTLNRFWRAIVKLVYPLLNAIITLNEDERNHYTQYNKRVVVIPNFITPPSSYRQKRRSDYILTVTRFNYIKGFDLLLDVAEKVFRINQSIRWKIIGYGMEEEKLIEFIRKKELQNRFLYIPAIAHDLTNYYHEASFFVLTSRNECFPLVLLEAQSHGLPIVAFDCDTGPRHIIENNKNGFLVEEEHTQKMSEAILALWDDQMQIETKSQSAIHSAKRFYPDTVFKLWDNLFQKKF